MTGCQRCGTLNADDARFCASCGSRLSTSCAVCGHEVAPDARFCPSCGEAVTRSGPAEERKVATVLFADVAGFTALGEALDPEVLRGVMGDYFAAMRAEIAWHGGSVEKFIGDAVVAVFGVPRASEDDVSRALRCALGMRRRLDELNTSLSRRVGVRLEMRIGVNTGEVLARPGAGPEEGLVTGDAVTVAARLEQLADPGRIVASERTARAARGFSFGPADQRHLKGRHEPVRIHELLGEPASELEVAAPVTMPLVDREEPLAFLTGILERAIEERAPRLVLIVGEPGTGKSRLAVELAHRAMARTPPARVLRGRCRPPTEASPYAPLGVALKKECGVLDDDRTPDALARIRESVSAIVGEEADRTVAALGWSIGLEDPDHTLRDLPARQVRYETLRAWRTWVEAIVRSGPAILVVEDLHWADPALLDLLEDLVERAEGPLLILGPSRPEVSERAPGWGRGPQRVHELPLDPLQPVHAEEIVRQLPGGDTLQPEEQRRIVARAEGNPFFLEELVHSVSDVHDDARHSSGRLPDTVQAVLAARIDRLPALDKRTLQLAAVCGRAFWPGLVRELSGIDGTALDPAFGRLVDRSLIVAQPASRISGEREYVFRHALTQEVAYAMLPRRERARAHAGVSRWLEATVDDRRREFELLAHHDETAHHLAAADPEAEPHTVEALRIRALEELLEAASDARSRSTVDAAQDLAQRAVQLARTDRERSLALEALGEAYLLGFWGDRAWETLREAALARVASDPADRRGIARLCAEALETPTRWGGMSALPSGSEAADVLRLGLESAGEDDSEEAVRLLTVRSMWPRVFGGPSTPVSDIEGARRIGEQAAAMALRLESPDLASAALDCVANGWYSLGLYERTEAVITQRLALVPRLRDPREVEDAFAMAAWVAFHRGRYREALDLADEGVRRTIEIAPTAALHSLEWRALARFALGDWAGFLAELDLARRLAPRREDATRAGFRRRPWAAAALAHELRGDPVAADADLEEMVPVAYVPPGSDIPGEDVRDLAEPGSDAPWMARLLARRGRFADARALVQIPSVPWWRDSAGLALEASCEIVALEGAWDDAAGLAQEARREAERGGLLALPGHADRLEGRRSMAAGDPGAARPSLERAAASFEAVGAAFELAVTRLDLAEVLVALGDRTAAARMAAAARSVVDGLGVVAESQRARRLI